MQEKKLCPLVRELLPGMIEGLLSPDAEEMVREHLADCADCRGMYEKLTKPVDDVPEVPVKEEIPVEKFVKRHRIRQWLLGVLTGIVLCVSLVFGFFYYQAAQDKTEWILLETSFDTGYMITEHGDTGAVSVSMKGQIVHYEQGITLMSVTELLSTTLETENAESSSIPTLSITTDKRTGIFPMQMANDGSLICGLLTIVPDRDHTKTQQYGYLCLDAEQKNMILWQPGFETGEEINETAYILCAGENIEDADDMLRLVDTLVQGDKYKDYREEMLKLIRENR